MVDVGLASVCWGRLEPQSTMRWAPKPPQLWKLPGLWVSSCTLPPTSGIARSLAFWLIINKAACCSSLCH